MDIVSAGFLILVVFLGGVIALVADNLGRRLGKKRHTLFGLRPRHTAAMMTAGAGILIPFITVSIITYASDDIRKWLFEGRQAIRESAELQRQVNDLKNVKSALDKDILDKTRQVQDLDRRLKAVSAQLELFKAKAAGYLARAQAASRRAAALRSQLAGLRVEIEKQKKQLALATGDIQQKLAEIKKMQRLSDTLDKEISLRDQHNAELNKENQRLEKELAGLNAEIEQLKQDRDSVQSQLFAAQGDLVSTSERLNKEIADKAAQLEELSYRLRLAEAKLEQNVDASRFKPMIFSFGEEINRLPILPNQSIMESRSALASLLRTARIAAEVRGAAADQKHQSADMWPLVTDKGTLSVEAQQKQIIDSIANRSEHFVLIAYSSFNTFKGEWVRLTVKGYRNPLVYTAGQTIAEGPIDGTKTGEDIVKQISDFIQTKVTAQAQSDKMIPVAGRENAFGTVPTEDLLALVKQIRETNRRVKLRVLAASDTRAADELKLKFVVR